MARRSTPYSSFASESDNTESEGGPWETAGVIGSIIPHQIFEVTPSIPLLAFSGVIFAVIDVSELGRPNTTLEFHWTYQGCYTGLSKTHDISTYIDEAQYTDVLPPCPFVGTSLEHQGVVIIDQDDHISIYVQSPYNFDHTGNATAYIGGFKLQLTSSSGTSGTSDETGRVSSFVIGGTQVLGGAAYSTSVLPSLAFTTLSADASLALSTELITDPSSMRPIHTSSPNFSTALNPFSAPLPIEENQSSRVVPIVCGTIGGLLLLGSVILACVWGLRRYRETRGDEDVEEILEDGQTVVAEGISPVESLWARKSYGYGIYTKV